MSKKTPAAATATSYLLKGQSDIQWDGLLLLHHYNNILGYEGNKNNRLGDVISICARPIWYSNGKAEAVGPSILL